MRSANPWSLPAAILERRTQPDADRRRSPQRAQSLRLLTRRMGTAKPQAWNSSPPAIAALPPPETRTAQLPAAARAHLTRAFIGSKVDRLRSAMDLEHSFGPAYVRGRLLRGTIGRSGDRGERGGVGADHRWHSHPGNSLARLLPPERRRRAAALRRSQSHRSSGAWRTTAERMAWLNHAAASFQLFTLDERSEELCQVDFRDTGNLESRLVHAFSPAAAIERCQAGIDRLLALVPPDRGTGRDPPALRNRDRLLLHGLEFRARAPRHGRHSFARENEITFGAGANETPLDQRTKLLPRTLLAPLPQPPSPTARTPTRSSVFSRSAGSNRASATTSPSCFRPAWRPALYAGARALEPATAACSTCSPSIATAASR